MSDYSMMSVPCFPPTHWVESFAVELAEILPRDLCHVIKAYIVEQAFHEIHWFQLDASTSFRKDHRFTFWIDQFEYKFRIDLENQFAGRPLIFQLTPHCLPFLTRRSGFGRPGRFFNAIEFYSLIKRYQSTTMRPLEYLGWTICDETLFERFATILEELLKVCL